MLSKYAKIVSVKYLTFGGIAKLTQISQRGLSNSSTVSIALRIMPKNVAQVRT
jgi:hypothetical protein